MWLAHQRHLHGKDWGLDQGPRDERPAVFHCSGCPFRRLRVLADPFQYARFSDPQTCRVHLFDDSGLGPRFGMHWRRSRLCWTGSLSYGSWFH